MNNQSTIEQRCLLFQKWEETGNIAEACELANLSRSTFYYWHDRFAENGYEALHEVRSHAPKNPRRLARYIADEIVLIKRKNPTWGKSRISKVLCERHKGPVVSPNSVRRVLADAGMWQEV